ncbi:MAG: hypothetical protein GWN31_04105, partial [Candidatus Thorarchaeota archaeon]|nr:hypothetical protein [Candidatus Thorarchaeota archaeon]
MENDFQYNSHLSLTIMVVISIFVLVLTAGCTDLNQPFQPQKEKIRATVEEGYTSTNDYSAIMITETTGENGKYRRTTTKVWFKKPLKYRYEHLSP